jgi:hypothetical protein
MKEDFEHWLFAMDDSLEHLMTTILVNSNLKLDYSNESLYELEKWMLNKYSNPQDLMVQKELHDGLARYVGETFRKNLAGKSIWTIKLDDPKFAFYALPILIVKESGNVIICPLTTVTSAIAREQGDFMSTILTNNIKKLIAC